MFVPSFLTGLAGGRLRHQINQLIIKRTIFSFLFFFFFLQERLDTHKRQKKKTIKMLRVVTHTNTMHCGLVNRCLYEESSPLKVGGVR